MNEDAAKRLDELERENANLRREVDKLQQQELFRKCVELARTHYGTGYDSTYQELLAATKAWMATVGQQDMSDKAVESEAESFRLIHMW